MAKDLNRCIPRLHSWVFIFQHFISDLFLFIETTTLYDWCRYNTMYSSDKNPNIVISRLKHVFAIISEWFYKNYMVLNPEKCHFLTLGVIKPYPDFSFTIIKNVKKKVHKYLNGYIPQFNEWSILFTPKPLQRTQL